MKPTACTATPAMTDPESQIASETRKACVAHPARLFIRQLSIWLLLSALVGPWIYVWRQSAKPSSPPVVAAPADLDLGEMWAASEYRHRVGVMNVSKEAISLSKIKASCRCTSIKPMEMTLSPGESKDVELVLDLSSLIPIEGTEPTTHQGKWQSDLEMTLSCVVEGSKPSRVFWSMSGRVRHPFHPNASAMRFVGADLMRKGKPGLPKTVVLTPHRNVLSLNAQCESEVGSVQIAKSPDARSFLLTFTPNDDLPVGRFNGNIIIDGRLNNGELLPGTVFPVSGEVVPVFSVIPAELHLTPAQFGKTERRRIYISSDEVRFSIVSAKASSSAIEWRSSSPSELRDRHELDVSILLAPAGDFTEMLSFELTTDAGTRERVSLPIKGYVISQ